MSYMLCARAYQIKLILAPEQTLRGQRTDIRFIRITESSIILQNMEGNIEVLKHSRLRDGVIGAFLHHSSKNQPSFRSGCPALIDRRSHSINNVLSPSSFDDRWGGVGSTWPKAFQCLLAIL